jgi:Zn-dependent membrane protease YugP
MYLDYSFLILVLPAILLGLYAQSKVQSAFRTYSQVRSSSGLTGREAARRILSSYGITDVAFEHISGNLTDHYDPRTGVIRLSDSVDSSTSVAAIGVAAHEAGHAVQYATGYFPIQIRSAIIPISQIGSQLSLPLLMFGAILGSQSLVHIGILLFATVAIFQLVTLPVEFDASRRALTALGASGMMTTEELGDTRTVLSAAAMTYVAALITSLAQLLRLILIFGGGRRRD